VLNPLLRAGQTVFSDMAFGFTSDRYLGEIFGIWNERYSSSTLLNVARLFYILPPWLLSQTLGSSGAVLMTSFIFLLVWVSALSMYLFTKRVVSVYSSPHFTLFKTLALITGALFYALNPWVIERIQHIYLLCGYSLAPLVLMFFFNAFDPKFQAQLIRGYNPTRVGLYRRNVLDLFLLALVFTVSAAAIHYFFYGIIFLGILGGLVFLKNAWSLGRRNMRLIARLLKNFILKLVVFGSFFVLLSSYWLFAYVGSILMHAQASQHNINVIDTLSLFSRNSSLKNVMFMISYWWPMFDLTALPLSFWAGGAILLLIIAYAVIFESRRKSIIVFFALLNLFFLVLATGVQINSFAPIFVTIVTKTPVIGTIFRDPNKIVGLMAIGWSVLLTFGVYRLFTRLDRSVAPTLFKSGLLVGVIVAFGFYIKPFYDHYIDGFYAPVQIPIEHSQVQAQLTRSPDGLNKVLYVPTADNMTQSGVGISTPTWNINNDPTGPPKATGDVQTYSSSKNTVFQHEGNPPNIPYSMAYLQHLLDTGQSTNIAQLVRTYGVDQLAYHTEYEGQSQRQAFNVDMLDMQPGLNPTYSNDIWDLYDVTDPLPYFSAMRGKVVSPYGLSTLETLGSVPNFDLRNLGVLFTTIEQDGEDILQSVAPGDFIELTERNDLLLSTLPAEDYLSPSDGINTGNPFLNWSKTMVSTPDWDWYMSSQDMDNFPWSFDLGAGLGVTFATDRLDVPPYRLSSLEGELVADFDSLLRTDDFFVADNPQIMSVTANPISNTNNIPILYGGIMRGDPKDIWQVAKSGLLDAKENTPYRFDVVLSGRGVDKIHAKVRFYDAQGVELGKSYVVAPTEVASYDAVDFTGDYVSPRGSRYMRIDLLTLQRPDQRQYWWIHDVKIWDYGEYSAPNTVTVQKKVTEPTKAHVYLRTMISEAGGSLEVTIGDQDPLVVDTHSDSINDLRWIDLGEYDFPVGSTDLTILNVKGFNAPNVFAIVPNDQVPQLELRLAAALDKAKVFTAMEAEMDFDYVGNVQSPRIFPKISNGEAIASQTGELSRELDIVKSGTYSLAIKGNAVPGTGGVLTVAFKDRATGLTQEYEVSADDFGSNGDPETVVVDQTPPSADFPRYLRSLPDVMDNYQRVDIPDIRLDAGSYVMSMRYDSRIPSLSTFDDIHKFDPNEIAPTVTVPDPYPDVLGYCDCVGITPDMMRDRVEGDTLRIDYDQTCSKSWYEYASKMIPVTVGEEFLFHARARSENIVQRHMKVLWLDENRNVVDVSYINDVEEKDKPEWNVYEQILQAPAGAVQMQFHILTHGNLTEDGYLEMQDYSIVPYADLMAVDNVMLFEGSDYDTFFAVPGTGVETSYKRVDTMSRTIDVSNPSGGVTLFNFMESPNPLWQMNLGTTHQRGTIAVNAVTTGFISDQEGQGDISIILRKVYYASFVFVLIGLVGFALLYGYYGRIEAFLGRRFGRAHRVGGRT
jgi:hypothetical protein